MVTFVRNTKVALESSLGLLVEFLFAFGNLMKTREVPENHEPPKKASKAGCAYTGATPSLQMMVQLKPDIELQSSLQAVHMLCRPKPYYNKLNKVAISYKNPLCLTCAKQVQPALYNGHEIIKDNYVPAIVHNTKDILEIAEITRRKMNDKMKDPECVNHKSQDLIKIKIKALKEQTTASRPIKALTVYPPNTPAMLVPRVLPTKSQVKIHIFTLIQLFLEFDKTCKKRITPTRLTKGERGFEQTKECYLKEVNQGMLSQREVFYVATNSELNVARLTEMHVANTIVEARCLELEAELSTLRDKSHNDNHNELVNRFSNLEVTALTTGNVNLKAQILNTVNSISKDHVKPTVLAPRKYAIDVEPIPSLLRNNRDAHLDYLRHLKESVKTIREIVEEAKVKTNVPVPPSTGVNRYTDASGSQPRSNAKKNRISPSKGVNKMQVVAKLNTQKTNVPVPPSTGVNRYTDASGSQPKSNAKKNRISPSKGVNKMQVVQIVLWFLDSSCSKHMTGDRPRLMNFVKKFIGTVRFRNDHFGAIMGYGDYVIGDSVISRVYYVEGLWHNLFSVRPFCDSNLEVAFRKHSCYVRDADGVELIKGSRSSNLYTISVEDMMKSSLVCLLSKASKNKSWLWHRRLNHLNFSTINDLARKDLVRGLPRLKFEKDHLCSACQLGKSKKHTYKPKTKNTNLEVLNTLHMD
uniref:Integrase, catalytic region, zinc finger, CCHC-type, peptidase aspartic, catalytic n=1 Tax=Tanacetum cinerariifolium TaxID=118510 RepID=A0A6L2MXE9_TANCI|nr:integrase, catalytic region, zinc finger, CCHC-type, peptidase aspartic, catalytic [Tanacetum cinerariifolium]